MANHLLYIDPGTGSLLVQVLVGAVVASAVFFKRIWYNVFSLFKGKKEDTDLE